MLVLGDSLSAAYGLPVEAGWVALLQTRIEANGLPHRVVNASVSGMTTEGGLRLLPELLASHRPALLLLQLGANDGLRGRQPEAIRANLKRLTQAALEADVEVVLLGIHLPPNYGPLYQRRFHAIYHEVAERLELPLLPFLLERVALEPGLMQSDGLHPTAEAQPLILDNVWPLIEPRLEM